MTLSSRLRDVRRVLFDPPQVHAAPGGVWRTERDCYSFLAEHCDPEMRTLETGLGVSTVLFALWGTRHICVVHAPHEVDALVAYMDARGIDYGQVSFEIGASQDVLPDLELDELDLMLIDGCHGFPMPIIDWFYGARWLRPGGWLVVDDLQLPSVSCTLGWFLELDPRWERKPRQGTWGAYQRVLAGSLFEEWDSQPFLGPPDPAMQQLRDRLMEQV